MKQLDSYIIPIALAVFAAGNLVVFADFSKKNKENRRKAIRNCFLWFLSLCIIVVAIANLFNGDSVFNLRKGISPNPPVPSENPATTYPVVSNTEINPTWYILPTESSETQPAQCTPDHTVQVDTLGLPSDWFIENESLYLDFFAEDFDSSSIHTPFDNIVNFLFSNSRSDESLGGNRLIIDYASFYETNSSDVPSMVTDHPAWDEDKYNAVYCEYHFENPIGVPFNDILGGCEIYDSSAQLIEIHNQHSDAKNGRFVVFLPNDLESGDYLIAYFVGTILDSTSPALDIYAFFYLHLG